MFQAARFAFSRVHLPVAAVALGTQWKTNEPTQLSSEEVASYIGNFHANLQKVMEAESESKAAPVRKSIVALIESDEEKREDGTSLAGTFVRLAWHCCGTYRAHDNTGGSNGARMRFDPEASYGNNAGLDFARAALEPIKEKYAWISYADLYTLAGKVAVEHCGGPHIPYQLGREDFQDGSTSDPKDRLPNADVDGDMNKTIQHIRTVFYRMGFNDREIVALLGAHALGRCHTDRSGYWGPWTNAETTFSNEYFRLLLEEEWTPKKTHNGEPWTGPSQYEDKTGALMMLPSDMALVQDPNFKRYVKLYAKKEHVFFKDFAKAFAKLLALGVPNQFLPLAVPKI